MSLGFIICVWDSTFFFLQNMTKNALVEPNDLFLGARPNFILKDLCSRSEFIWPWLVLDMDFTSWSDSIPGTWLHLYRFCWPLLQSHYKHHIELFVMINLFTYFNLGPSWLWSYGSWIYNYLCNQCLSPLKLWVRTLFMARCTWYNIRWSSLSVTCDRSVVFSRYSTNKADHHDITEILLKVALNTISFPPFTSGFC